MRVTVTGATGLIGSKLVAALKERGDDVTVLSRRPADAQRKLGVEAIGWNSASEPAPAAALAGSPTHSAARSTGRLYGEMASVVTTGQRVLPARALEHGFAFRHAAVDGALEAAVRSR